MKKTAVFTCIFLLFGGSLISAEPRDRRHALPLDDLLGIASVISGRDAPQWSPDGAGLLWSSSLYGGGLVISDHKGGFPVRVPLRIPGMSQARWSPDGGWIAGISSQSGSPEIWLWSSSSGLTMRLTNMGGDIKSFCWSPDGGRIAFSGDRYGNYDIWTVTVPEGRMRRITSDRRYEVFPSWAPDSSALLYVRMDERWIDHDVIVVTPEGKNPRTLIRDTDFFDYRGGSAFGAVKVSPDGKSVLFRSHRSGWINYWIMPFEGGTPRPLDPEKADQNHASWSPDGKHVALTSNYDGTHKLKVVPAAGGGARILVDPEIGVCANPEWSPDAQTISYTFADTIRPPDLYTVSLTDGRRRQLTFSMPSGGFEEKLIRPEKFSYPSADGLNISAYLYKPKNIQPGDKFPAVLWLHGGPTGQFHDSFQQHVQFFAQRGYVVMLPNVRGGSGYGKAFEKANNKGWGKHDLKDVKAAVRYLKNLDYVDDDHLGVTGTSYGGDLTQAIITHAPGLFQAAIPCSGEADWTRAYHENYLGNVKLWDYELGPLDENRELYRELSPITYVADVTTPTFVIHGEGRYPESQLSKLLATELQRHDKVVRYKAYPNENFYVRRLENRRQQLLDMLDFFDQFLLPHAPPRP